MRRTVTFLTGVLVLASFLCVALVQSWPLPLHLWDRFTGSTAGDTSVYVWNTWVFRHELVGNRSSPFHTETVLAFGGPADLSLHNYTVFANVLALPLQPWLGTVATFNVVYLINFALAGLGMFLLVRRLPQTSSASTAEAWLAALLFASSPFLVARGNGHFSVAAAAPLPFFVWCFHRTLEERRLGSAAGAGACVAWAAYSDPYQAIYCVLLAVALLLARVVDVQLPKGPPARASIAIRALDFAILALIAAVVVVHFVAGGELQVGPAAVSMRTLYTPMLALTLLIAARLWQKFRPRVRWTPVPFRPLVMPAVVLVSTASLLLGPMLWALVARTAEGAIVRAPVLWRSSAPGVDLVALFLPNPNHPLAPAAMVDWLQRQPGEGAASIPWVAILVLVAAWRLTGHRHDRAWMAIALVFASLTLGPFVRIAGIDTLIPTPWTFARYLPVIGEARMPGRLSVVVILAVAVLFAAALPSLTRRRRAAFGLVAAALAFELAAAPRQLHATDVPAIFDTIAADARDVRVLHLPFGIRDGLSTFGNFNPAALYYQTAHHKPLVSGYLSRISGERKMLYLTHPFMGALIRKSEGHALTAAEREAALAAAGPFLREASVGWVVIDERETTPALQAFAVESMQLTLRERSDSLALYAPQRTADAADRRHRARRD